MHTLTTTLLASLALTFCLHSTQAQTTLPGEAAYNLGNFEAARKELTAAEGFETNPRLMLLHAKIDIAENKLDVAENRVDEIIAEMPNNAAAHRSSWTRFTKTLWSAWCATDSMPRPSLVEV